MDLDRAVQLLQAAAAAIAVWRLIDLRLAKVYRALFAWLCVLVASNLFAAVPSRFHGFYFWFYLVYVPVYCLFSILAVQELFVLVFRDYPGIRSVGVWAMYIGTFLATVAAFLLSAYFRRTGAHGSQPLYYAEFAQRSIVFGLAVVIATILFALSRYPLRLSRNTLRSSTFFSILFLSEAVRLLIDSLQILLYNDKVDQVEGCFVVVCLVVWAALLQPVEADKPRKPTLPTAKEEHLLAQLAALNQLLGGTVRR